MSSTNYSKSDVVFIPKKVLCEANWRIVYEILKSHTRVCSFLRACRKNIRYHVGNHLDEELARIGDSCENGIEVLSGKEIKIV